MSGNVAGAILFESMLYGAVAALAYSAVWYNRARVKNNEPFKPSKALATLIVGMLVGAGLALAGADVTQENVVVMLSMYAGLIAVIEGLLKTLADWYSPPDASAPPDPDPDPEHDRQFSPDGTTRGADDDE